MTDEIDRAFVERVRAALDGEVRATLDEAGGDAWRRMQHRRLAERVKALVAAWCDAGDDDLLAHAGRLAGMLRGRQGASGLFRGGDNVDSPPDSAFSVNDLGDAALLLRLSGRGGTAADRLAAALDGLLAAVTPALVTGGVHTPNHRWEISAALARLHRLAPRAALADRVEQWLAEGVDIADGLYSERSANYAAHVSNPSLLVIAEVFDRPELVDAVERNLTATLDLLLPDGSVETVLSRRQDQRSSIPLAPYLLPLRRVARLRGRGDLAWAAGVAQAQGIVSPGDAAAQLRLDPAIGGTLPAPVEPARPRQRVFDEARLVMDHRPAATTVVFGGSDFPRHGRIRSGLANSPTFLRMYAGSVVLDSVRLSRVFFGRGPFRGDRFTVAHPEAGAATVVTMGETVAASYYQPLAAGDRDAGGRYRLADDGRFSAAMDFERRERDEVALTTAVRVEITDGGAELTVEVGGAEVDWALELAFRPGGAMSGARPSDGAGSWQLDASATGVPVRYQVGRDSLSVTVVEASDGAGGPLGPAAESPAYHPGEDYEFLGGTDAANGELLYLGGCAPARVRIDVKVETREYFG